MSGNSGQLVGKVTIRVDGNLLETENKATLTPEGVKREPIRHGGKTYYSEEETAPELVCKVLLTKSIDVKTLNEIDNATVLFEADTGHKYYLRKAFSTEVVAFDGEGVAEMKMSADSTDKV